MNATEPTPWDAYREQVLEQLQAAGSAGLAQGKLIDSKKTAVRKERLEWLAALVASGEIQSQRKGNATRCWIQGRMPVVLSQEEKADEVLRAVFPEQRRGRLFTVAKIRTELLKGEGIKEPALQTCLRVLEQQGVLLKLTEGSRALYAYAPALREWLGLVVSNEDLEAKQAPIASKPVETKSEKVTTGQVVEAYRKVRIHSRMPDIEIARLRDVLGCAPDDLKPAVLELCQQGVFIPGKGDWSFASAPARAAAILIQNVPYLFVRMKE
jgi:hypothetical protein